MQKKLKIGNRSDSIVYSLHRESGLTFWRWISLLKYIKGLIGLKKFLLVFGVSVYNLININSVEFYI